MVEHKQKPTIRIAEELKKDLDKAKLCPTETYESVVERMIKERKKKLKQQLRDLH